MADRRAVNSHDASTVVSVVNIQQARPSTIDMPWRNFRSPQLGTKFQREVLLFLEIPEFPYNTVYIMSGSIPPVYRPFILHCFDKHFYPRDAMLARVLAVARCLSVSVTSLCL